MSARPDTTLYWCLERLATSPNVPFDALYDFVGKLNASHDIQSQFPPLLHIRLILCGLLKTEAVTHDTLKTMNHLERKVAEVYGANAPDMTPPPELMLQIKTELVAQTWRYSVATTPSDIVQAVQAVFGSQIVPHETSRYNELIQASANPNYRLTLDRVINPNMVIQGIKRYAEKAAETAGPSLLETINEDINSGRYIPGAAATAPVPTQIQAMPVNLSVMSPTRVAQMAAPLASLQFPHHGTASADIQNRQGMPPLPHGMNLHGGKGTAPAPLAYEYQPTRSVATYPAVAAEENLVDNYQGPDEGPHVYGSPLQLISSAEKRKRAEGLLPGLKSARRDLTDHVNGEGNFMAGICDLSNVAAQHAANAPGEAAFAAADTLAALPYTRMNTPPDATLPTRPRLPMYNVAQHRPLDHLDDILVRGRPQTAAPRSSGNRRRSLRWSEEEVAALLEGCRRFKHGSWSYILERLRDRFHPHRTQVDLKDKWRNLRKSKIPQVLEIENRYADGTLVAESGPYAGVYQTPGIPNVPGLFNEDTEALAPAPGTTEMPNTEAIEEATTEGSGEVQTQEQPEAPEEDAQPRKKIARKAKEASKEEEEELDEEQADEPMPGSSPARPVLSPPRRPRGRASRRKQRGRPRKTAC